MPSWPVAARRPAERHSAFYGSGPLPVPPGTARLNLPPFDRCRSRWAPVSRDARRPSGYARVDVRSLGFTILLAWGCLADDDAAPSVPADLIARHTAARCDAAMRCECRPPGWIDREMCVAEIHARLEARLDALRSTDARLDSDCLDSVLAWWRSSDACADPSTVASVPYCAVASGEQAEGERCASLTTHAFSASSCADGLYCGAGDVCSVAPTVIELAAGEPCVDAPYACVDGTWCDGDTGRCAPRSSARAPCTATQACDAQTWCAGLDGDTPGVCTPRGGTGADCTGATQWDPRPCAPEQIGERSFTRWCVDDRCTGRVPAACGPWP